MLNVARAMPMRALDFTFTQERSLLLGVSHCCTNIMPIDSSKVKRISLESQQTGMIVYQDMGADLCHPCEHPQR